MTTTTRRKGIEVGALGQPASADKKVPAIQIAQVGGGRRAAARGWGQIVYAADGSWSWPAGVPRRAVFRFDDPIDDQLRHGIAWSRSSSHDLARAAGLSAALVDRFMRGADCLSLVQAARLAPLVGLRLADQSLIEGYLAAWERTGEPVVVCPPNRLVKRAAARLRRVAR
jgi:hypothetical protein